MHYGSFHNVMSRNFNVEWSISGQFVKSVQIQGFFDPCFAVFGPEKTPYSDNFYVVGIIKKWEDFLFYRPRNG